MIKQITKGFLRPVLTHFRPGNVVMFHLGRCGSTVVADLLNQHPRIQWAGELYEPIFRVWRKNNKDGQTVGEMPDDAINILRKNMRNALHRYYGFEIKPFHFDLIGYPPKTYLRHLESLGFTHFIILDRKNRLKKEVSSLIARQNEMFHIRDKTKAKLTRIPIDLNNITVSEAKPKSLIDHLENYDKQIHELKILLEGRDVLRLNYEEDVQSDPKRAYLRICEFLDLKPLDVSVNLSRTNPFPLKDMIENFEEVSESLRGTPYEWMLDD